MGKGGRKGRREEGREGGREGGRGGTSIHWNHPSTPHTPSSEAVACMARKTRGMKSVMTEVAVSGECTDMALNT